MLELIKKHKKVIIIVASSIICVILFLVGIVSSVKNKTKNVDTSASFISQEVASEVVTSELVTVSSSLEVDSTTDLESDEYEVVKPIDCQNDFWAVKYGIAEAYDHLFKKGHMTGTVYYQGDCDNHDPVEINELARKVKLYRDDSGCYTAILPEIEWSINIYDEKIHEIIDAQIDGSGEVYSFDEISIVIYYLDNDNSITIEAVKE